VIKQKLDKLREKATLTNGFVRIVVGSALVITLSALIFLTYDEYKKTIVTQQQQEMLVISKSISENIERFTDDIINSLGILTLDKEFIKDVSKIEKEKSTSNLKEKLKAYYEAEGKTIASVCYFDKYGNPLIQYPSDAVTLRDWQKKEVYIAIEKKKTYIGREYLSKIENRFVLNIYEPVFDSENFKGLISVSVGLDVIYNELIAPVKIGEKGYAMVKDQFGTIIMHPVKEQIGMDVIATRKQVYPDLDFQELESLVRDQLRGEEGTAVYHSYWWGESTLKKVRKLSAYTPVKFEDRFWVVALTMSYDEIQGPINKFLGIIIGIASVITVIIYFFVSALIRMKKNKEKFEKETVYLKMLNEASEQLRKKEAELYHSNKLKMIGTLAGGIAHDINNLLTPILGYSELLLMRLPEGSEYYEEIEEILKASQKGRDLIEQILSFSRKDNGIVKVEYIDANEVIKETLKLLKAVLPRNIVVMKNIKENCGYIYANFTQIHEIIFNLCTNAYQSIKNNDGEIEISLSSIQGREANSISDALSAERDYVEIMIRDTGCGMDEETKARIFDPFFTTKDIGEGTGLGLFVVQSVVDKYKGAIAVESEVNVGSCFKVYLPLVEKELGSVDSCNCNHMLSESKRILVVDDNNENIKVIKKGLEHVGHEVVTEVVSKKALRTFQSDCDNFDIVITDYMMPDLKGGELAAEIKKIKKDTVVILMSGYIDENEVTLSNSKSIDGFIPKPIELSKLLQVIEKIS
jgi:two-component system, cell cycle sensor histidine kinase and response regulator CckA